MIKRKVKAKARKVKKCKNPKLSTKVRHILNDISYPDNEIEFKFIGEGMFGESYYFELTKNKYYLNTIIKPGEYILKVFKSEFDLYLPSPDIEELDYLKLLSKYGLIPKIFIITKKFMIMKFIEGTPMIDYTINEIINHDVVPKIEKLIKKWHELGFAHGDLKADNILITKNYKIYLIDPYFANKDEFKYDLDVLNSYKNKYCSDSKITKRFGSDLRKLFQ
jgi:predicted Ser/Thr protein kinase